MKIQIADARRPLASVAKLCDVGNEVRFTHTGGERVNVKTGKKTPLTREGNLYYLLVAIDHEKTIEGEESFRMQGQRTEGENGGGRVGNRRHRD